MDAFSITTTLTKKEYTSFFYRESYKNPYTIAVTLLGLYLLISTAIDMAQPGPVVYLNFLKLALGLFILLIPTLNVFVARKNTFSNPAAGHPVTYTFSASSIHIKTLTSDVTSTWQSIIKVKDTGNFLLLHTNKKLANFVKKDALTAEQIVFIKSKAGK